MHFLFTHLSSFSHVVFLRIPAVEDIGKAVDIKHETGQHSKCIFIQVFISKSCSQNLLSWAFVDQACVKLFSKQNSAGRRMNSISCYITLCCPQDIWINTQMECFLFQPRGSGFFLKRERKTINQSHANVSDE